MQTYTMYIYQPEQVQAKREKIRQDLLKKSNYIKDGKITSLSVQDLKLLYELYDAAFFAGQLHKAQLDLTFSLSRRMTKSAGKTIYQPVQDSYEIRIGADLFFAYHQIAGSGLVCGLKTKDSLEALQLVFEHELCHVFERLLFGSSSCRNDRFKKLASRTFGHLSSHHELNSGRLVPKDEPLLQIGDQVSFEYKGHIYEGFINNITKRATVMVKNPYGDFRDQAGQRYSKYYVPQGSLTKKIDPA